jgi:malonyl-CoA/methylmalonyl-CoA synthetase
VIRRILDELESQPAREVFTGLDAAGAIAWRQSAAEVLELAARWQARLRRRGVRPGARVAIELPRGPQLFPAHLAVLAAGASVVPLNPALRPVERERVLERAGVQDRLDAGARPAEGPDSSGHLALAEPPAGTPALLVFTSGTTGEPKGVPLGEANLEANLAALHAAWGLSSADRILHLLPAHHVHGLVLALYGSARAGIPVVLGERFDAERCLEALASRGITLFMGVPTMYHRMLQAAGRCELPGMRLFVSGSAPLPRSDALEFESRFGQRPLERYGLTETLIVSSNPLRGERRPGTVGFPLDGTQARIDADGEILVRGPAVMAGYWRAPDSARDAFCDGFFRTGDLGSFDAQGYLTIAGRKKELILVGGSNVVPGEVERALAGDPAVDELAVAGLPDPDLGEVVAAFVVARAAGDEPAIEGRLRERADDSLASYKRPRVYRFVSALPRNAMGKLDRKVLATIRS